MPEQNEDPAVPVTVPVGAGENYVELDSKGLRALAHPVRVQLVGQLRLHGPLTATRLAERLNISSGTASYHLRQLAAAGFVAEDTERGNARERWWRALHHLTWLKDPAVARQDPEATTAYLAAIAHTYADRLNRAILEYPLLPQEWQENFNLSDRVLLLTPSEAEQLRTELSALVMRYRMADPEGTASAPPEARRVGVNTYLMPEPAAHPPQGPDSPEHGDDSATNGEPSPAPEDRP